LADPQLHEDGKAIDWYADWPGAVQPLSALDPARKEAVLAEIGSTLADIRRLGDTLPRRARARTWAWSAFPCSCRPRAGRLFRLHGGRPAGHRLLGL